MFPATHRFAGGKGVATALGVLIVLSPGAALSAMAAFMIVLSVSGYVSLASMSATLVVPLVLALLRAPAASLVAGSAMALVTALRHRDNVRRLLNGTEPRLALHKKQATHRK